MRSEFLSPKSTKPRFSVQVSSRIAFSVRYGVASQLQQSECPLNSRAVAVRSLGQVSAQMAFFRHLGKKVRAYSAVIRSLVVLRFEISRWKRRYARTRHRTPHVLSLQASKFVFQLTVHELMPCESGTLLYACAKKGKKRERIQTCFKTLLLALLLTATLRALIVCCCLL